MEDYSIRVLTAEDLPLLNKLFSVAFNYVPKLGFLEWKYFANPAGNAILIGVFCNIELVGAGAMLPEKIILDNTEKLVYKCTDLMIHPNHQKKGLSVKINKLLLQKTQEINPSMLYTFCSKTSTKSFLKHRWVFIEGIVNFFKPYILLKLTYPFNKSSGEFTFTNELISSQLHSYNFNVNRKSVFLKKSVEFIKWRTSNPNFLYKIICAYNKESILAGYLIYSISSNNLINVLDIDTCLEDRVITKELLCRVEKLVVEEKRKGIMIMSIKNSPLFKISKKRKYLVNTFNRGPLKTVLDFDVYFPEKKIDSVFKSPAKWDFNGLNYDDI